MWLTVSDTSSCRVTSANTSSREALRFVRNARDSGHSCIFIAHNIHHVFQVVDRIVVMRRGKVVADDIDPKKTNVAEVERIITGMSDKEIRDAIVEGKPSYG